MMENMPPPGERTLSAGRTLWLYGYELVQPDPAQAKAIRDLLDRANDGAQRGDRTWSARLVTEHHATHVLVVSTSPGQDFEINRKLEAELKAMGIEFLLTLPMPVRDETPPHRSTDPCQS